VILLTAQAELALFDLTVDQEPSLSLPDRLHHKEDLLVHDEPKTVGAQYPVPQQEDPQPYIRRSLAVTNKIQGKAA
ncbi:uncharacterized protein METZ01_LOCUS516883, partial [marine metagenome]